MLASSSGLILSYLDTILQINSHSSTDFILSGDMIFQINLVTQVHLSIQTVAIAMLVLAGVVEVGLKAWWWWTMTSTGRWTPS